MALSLGEELLCLSENVTHAFLLVTPECIAIFRDRDCRFGVFDSHSRNSAGLPQPYGTAIMMTFSNRTAMLKDLQRLFQNRGPNATYEFVPVGFVRNNQALTFQNVSLHPTHANPTVRKPENAFNENKMPPWLKEMDNVFEEVSPTAKASSPVGKPDKDLDEEEMSPWLREMTNVEEIAPKVPQVTKVEKAKRRKFKDRLKSQQKQNTTTKNRQSASEKQRYNKSPTFRNKKLQALKEKYYLQQSQRRDHMRNRYKVDDAFKTRQKKFKYNFLLDFRARHKSYIAKYRRTRYRDDPIFRSQEKVYIRTRYRDDPVFKNQQKAYIRTRYRDDPVFKNQQKAYIRTCLQPPDLAQEVLSYGDGIFSIAPAQGNKPVSFFSVPRLESMAYPVQFPTGRNTLDEVRRVKLSPSMYFNVRLFSVDTRFAADQSYLSLLSLSLRPTWPTAACLFKHEKENRRPKMDGTFPIKCSRIKKRWKH
ncbi:uncharacterized protein LOC118560192 isoform X2 [Fundulus heteroclitus]|uniref:uncharacterized protein LOC118560192 isoform X1 n=1 Tax=Fundulus heteroclitus TaxID=8078 RepID=UPI00165C05D2|nr:uncharacterized protein LOC118560192 isoform X1 [Fundulus heteroclitus]XP_035986913.1 uncharacterized protein LOC118560192 isoform X2 [Fundulus heteroclitus]